MLKNAQDLVIQRLEEDEQLQSYFREKTGLRLTVTTNPNDIVPPAGFLSLAGGEIHRGGSTSEVSFTLLLLLPYFKNTQDCLEAVDGVILTLFQIKQAIGMVTIVGVGDLIPPADDSPTWTVPLTITMTL